MSSRESSMLRFGGYLLWFHLASAWSQKNKHSRNFLWCSRFYGKDFKTILAKIIAHLTNSSPFKKHFSNWPIKFPGSNLDSGEINGNMIGSVCSKDLTVWARDLSPTSTTRSEGCPSPLASEKNSGIQGRIKIHFCPRGHSTCSCSVGNKPINTQFPC